MSEFMYYAPSDRERGMISGTGDYYYCDDVDDYINKLQTENQQQAEQIERLKAERELGMKKTGVVFMGCGVWLDTDDDSLIRLFELSIKDLNKEAYGEEASRYKALGRVAELKRQKAGM